MRHRIGMILAAMMTGVLFFPGSGGTCGSCAFPPRQASFPGCRAPAAVEDQGGAPRR
jgi:hypothetical protein